MLDEILRSLLRSPKTTAGLAQDTGAPVPSLDAALMQLTRGGYVARSDVTVLAATAASGCSDGCGVCSVHNLCPSSSASEPDPTPVVESWHLTAKGRARARPGFTPLPVRKEC